MTPISRCEWIRGRPDTPISCCKTPLFRVVKVNISDDLDPLSPISGFGGAGSDSRMETKGLMNGWHRSITRPFNEPPPYFEL